MSQILHSIINFYTKKKFLVHLKSKFDVVSYFYLLNMATHKPTSTLMMDTINMPIKNTLTAISISDLLALNLSLQNIQQKITEQTMRTSRMTLLG